jgi:hypothetical protein
MQRRNLGKAMRYLVAVCALGSAFALFACSSDDDDSGEQKNVNATVAVTNSTVAAVQGVAIPIQQGQVFSNVSGQVTLTFSVVPNRFTLVNNTTGAITAGSVQYGTVNTGSCNFIADVGGASLLVGTCNLIVFANNVTAGTGQVQGTITLVFNGPVNGVTVTVNSGPLTATVFLNSSDELFVVNPATGASVDMGIQP